MKTATLLEYPTQCYPDMALCLMCGDEYRDMTSREDHAIIGKAVLTAEKKGKLE